MSKLACKVDGKPGLIVGYGPSRRGKITAIVVLEGRLRAVRLKDIELENLPAELARPAPRVVPLRKAEPKA